MTNFKLYRKLIFIALLFITITSLQAQETSTYPSQLTNLNLRIGTGILPYGTESLNWPSEVHQTEKDHILCNYYGLSYHSTRFKVGLTFDYFNKQQYRSLNTLVLIPHDINTLTGGDVGTSVQNFRTQSTSYNVAVTVGDEIAKNFTVLAKAGVGYSSHNYAIGYTPQGANYIFEESSTQTLNSFLGLEMRYFPIKNIGVSSAFGYSNEVPMFSLGVIGRYEKWN